MKKNILYTLMCLFIYMALSGIDILAKPLVGYIGESFKIYFIVYNILLIFVNPIITKLIADKIYVSFIDKKTEEVDDKQQAIIQ